MRWSRDGHYERGIASLPAAYTGLVYMAIQLHVEIGPSGWSWELVGGVNKVLDRADYRRDHHPYYCHPTSREEAEREAYVLARQRLPADRVWDEVREALRRLAGR
jgi:hypothetical protein